MPRARGGRALAGVLGAAVLAPAVTACVPWDGGTSAPAVVNETSSRVLVTVTGTDLDVSVPAGRTWEGEEDASCVGTAIVVRAEDGTPLAEFDHPLCSTTVVEVRADGSVSFRDYADDTRETATPSAVATPGAGP
ncbi:hypothetical protein [Cellulomonas hominis]|uniref:hypothetical protein n=1 Tax=Cellulomonas hominis TaxID=156981 RepID=UPI001B9EBBE6|nr:hypothetical protein [Cellulomonas hominis]VTR76524.1 hypothetical protein CHMI_01285 [Cellulomonas hominis]